MCGVVAIVGRGLHAPPVDRAELLAIRDDMVVRGPDGRGEWISSDGRAALAHRRLAIIGLGEQGAQPMVLHRRCRPAGGDSGSGAAVISFNGEIYNHRELRQKLEAGGHRFQTACDTEVLLHLYEDAGDGLTESLRGMYAFAIWDEGRTQLLLGRDPYGIKPLYYADDGETVRAASQVRALMRGGAIPHRPDTTATVAFFMFGNVPEPLTSNELIRSVPSGTVMTFGPNGPPTKRTTFSLAKAWQQAGERPESGEDRPSVRQALLDSVRSHLVADVDVGVFLSAGIDSGAVLGLAAEASPRLRAVTLGFDEFAGTGSDEVPLATDIAGLYGAHHVSKRVTLGDFKAWLPEFLNAMDQPSIDGANTWMVSKVAAESGLKVVLSGTGGDELFGGYSTFTSVPGLARRLRPWSHVPGSGTALRLALGHVGPRRLSPKTAGVLDHGRSLPEVWFLRRALFLPRELDRMLGPGATEHALSALPAILGPAMTPDPGDDFGRVATLEGALYLRNQLLRDTDWAGMAHSLEVRVPLVDPTLLGAVAPAMACGRSRGPGKETLAVTPRPPLPATAVSRAKSGFSLPLTSWIDGLDEMDSWRQVPALCAPGTPWARRWAFATADRFGLV